MAEVQALRHQVAIGSKHPEKDRGLRELNLWIHTSHFLIYMQRRRGLMIYKVLPDITA